MKILEVFLDELYHNKNLSSNTIIAYEKDIFDYIEYFEKKGISILHLDEKNYFEYFEVLKNRVTYLTFRRKHSSIKNFNKYLYKNKQIDFIYEYKINVNENKKNIFKNKVEENKFTREDYKNFLLSLGDSFPEKRLKLFIELVIDYQIPLTDMFDIKVNDLIKYDFKKIVIVKNNKIKDYSLNKKMEKELKEYYDDFIYEKRFLFSLYNGSMFYKDLKRFNLSLTKLKGVYEDDNKDILEKIRKKYFEIGIGD